MSESRVTLATIDAAATDALSASPSATAVVQDFIRIAVPPPDWLEKGWRGAKRRGLDKLTPGEINC